MIDTITFSLSPLTKWVLGIAGSMFTSYLGYMSTLAYKAFTNCIPTIQKNGEETNKILLRLEGYFKAKAEDGKL